MSTEPTPSTVPDLEAIQVFEELVELAVTERAVRLEALERERPELARSVASLLAADAAEGLEEPLGSVTSSGPAFGTCSERPRAVGSVALEVGDRLGPYRIESVLGSGGMGVVFAGRRVDGAFEQTVAIKVLHSSRGDDLVRRFAFEREVLGRLDHPGIARILDAGETADSAHYLVMERVEGQRLDAFCEARRLRVRERVALLVEVCRAVSYAHRNLVIHRDLKPANILVTAEGSPKLLDFGIAKLLEPRPGPALTRTGLGPLTPEYASPEQILGEPVTTATDVYSLGVILYELLCGRRPFEAHSGSRLQLERSVVERDASRPSQCVEGVTTVPEPVAPVEAGGVADDDRPFRSRGLVSPGQLRRELRGDLDNIALQALDRSPDRRYQSVAELAADLERYLEGRPVAARGASLAYQARKFLRRHWLVVGAATAVLVALSIGLGSALWQARIAQRERDLTRQAALESDQMNRFLIDLLAAPGGRYWRYLENAGPETRVIDVLDEAARRLETELDDAPLARASLHLTLADTFMALGREGEEQARRALELRRAELGPLHPLVAESTYYLAAATPEPEGRLRLLQEAIDLEQRLDRPTNNYPYALADASMLAARLGWSEPVLRWLELARNDVEERHGDGGPEAILWKVLNGRALARMGQLEPARRSLREARVRIDGQSASLDARSLSMLEQQIAVASRLTEWLSGDLERASEPGGFESPREVSPSQALYDLGELRRARSRLDGQRSGLLRPEARAVRRALEARLALRLDGDVEDCVALAEEALRLEESWARGPNWFLAEARSTLGECLAARGEHERARALLESARAMLSEVFDEQSPLLRRAENAISRLDEAGLDERSGGAG